MNSSYCQTQSYEAKRYISVMRPALLTSCHIQMSDELSDIDESLQAADCNSETNSFSNIMNAKQLQFEIGVEFAFSADLPNQHYYVDDYKFGVTGATVELVLVNTTGNNYIHV